MLQMFFICLVSPSGDLIHQVSQSASHLNVQAAYMDPPPPPSTSTSTSSSSSSAEHGNTLLEPSPPSLEPQSLHVAAKAYSLSSVLMLILMHARVLNEEPLVLGGAEIAATGKLADPQSLLCYHGNNSPGGVFSVEAPVGEVHEAECEDRVHDGSVTISLSAATECQRFSIPRAFNKSLGRAAAGSGIMQLLFQVTS